MGQRKTQTMAQEIKITATVRDNHGSAAARRYRRAGIVPAILKKEDGSTVLLSLNAHDFERLLGSHVSENLVVTVDVAGASTLSYIHEVQRDGLTGRVIHADFGQIDPGKKMRIQVPVILLGDAIGVTRDAGILETGVRNVDVECLPMDVVEDFTLDISDLGVGQAVHVRDLNLGDKYQILTHADLVVASVREVKVEAAPAADAAEAAPAADAAKK